MHSARERKLVRCICPTPTLPSSPGCLRASTPDPLPSGLMLARSQVPTPDGSTSAQPRCVPSLRNRLAVTRVAHYHTGWGTPKSLRQRRHRHWIRPQIRRQAFPQASGTKRRSTVESDHKSSSRPLLDPIKSVEISPVAFDIQIREGERSIETIALQQKCVAE